jgi:hypothetical protein
LTGTSCGFLNIEALEEYPTKFSQAGSCYVSEYSHSFMRLDTYLADRSIAMMEELDKLSIGNNQSASAPTVSLKSYEMPYLLEFCRHYRLATPVLQTMVILDHAARTFSRSEKLERDPGGGIAWGSSSRDVVAQRLQMRGEITAANACGLAL